MKEEIGTQVTFTFEIKLQKYIFQQNMTNVLAAIVSFQNPRRDRNINTYATTKELKNKTFKVQSQNTKQEIGIQVNLISGKKA